MTINRLVKGLANSVAKQRAGKAKAKKQPTFGHLRQPEPTNADTPVNGRDARAERAAELRNMVEGKPTKPAAGSLASKIAATKKRVGIPD